MTEKAKFRCVKRCTYDDHLVYEGDVLTMPVDEPMTKHFVRVQEVAQPDTPAEPDVVEPQTFSELTEEFVAAQEPGYADAATEEVDPLS